MKAFVVLAFCGAILATPGTAAACDDGRFREADRRAWAIKLVSSPRVVNSEADSIAFRKALFRAKRILGAAAVPCSRS